MIRLTTDLDRRLLFSRKTFEPINQVVETPAGDEHFSGVFRFLITSPQDEAGVPGCWGKL